MNFGSFDLNLLRVLDALLATGSTTEAGQKIGLSQPAVSAALGRLRHVLGDPLFLRQGRKLRPTDFARELRDPLRELLERTEMLLSGSEEFSPATAVATFRLSGSDFFAEMLMPDLAKRVAHQAPGIRLQLVDLVPESYVGTLDRYQVDLALIPRTDFPNWIDHAHLFNSSFVAIARRGHPRLSRAGVKPGGVIPLDLFCDLGHVLFSPEGKLTALGDAALAKVGRARHVVMTMPVFSGVYKTVARSDLVALIPQHLAKRVAPQVGLNLYQPPMAVPTADLRMVWHRRATRNPAHRWLRGQISELMQPLDDNAAGATQGRGG